LVGVNGVDRDAVAGGVILYELGTPDVGRASSGWAARAGDAATRFTNRAGMSRLRGKELLGGGQLTYGQFGFEPNQNTTVTGNDGGNAVGWLPGGSVFYTHEIGSGWNAGIGAFSYFGLAAEYDQGWVGRYYVQESALIGFTLMPAVSYRVNEHLSFGAGFNWMFGIFDQKMAVRNILQQTDGAMKLNDNTQGFGANVGALWELSDEFRLGLTYLSQVELDFKDTPEFTGLGPVLEAALGNAGVLGAEIDLGMTVPHMVMASAYHELSDEFAFMGNFGWQNWNSFGKVEVSLGDTLLALTADLDYKDTWHVAFGAAWDVTPVWLVTGGIAYDTSPVDDANRTVQLPMGETLRLGAGGQWAASEAVKLGFVYQVGWMGNLAVDQYRQVGNQVLNRVAGRYENTALHTFAVNMVWDI
jgi:long-chain fatty acid transport protein